jgi:hypothetical protein
MSDPIIDRIDALVKKRRSFVAGSTATTPAPVADNDDDLPLLTDIVELAEVAAEAPGPDTVAPLQPMLDALAADLAHAIEDRLALDLPEILETAVEELRSQLRVGIAGSVESATRDFLARRQQLRLPFPVDSDK